MPQPCSFPLGFGSCFYFSSRFLSLCFKRKFLWEIVYKFFLIFIISYFIEYAQCTHAFAIADRFTSPTKIQGTWVSSSTEFHILLRWKHEITFLKKWSSVWVTASEDSCERGASTETHVPLASVDGVFEQKSDPQKRLPFLVHGESSIMGKSETLALSKR